ncbi:phospholipase C, phosphocholine-specific [Saccharopolyspora sp. K220]|uniref:phosphocholine-specific phospholipase C n=1 Tax=Saccharopolyspora soli TaxID=2926618 RepID=UPI001F580616|nr:phospholipase C, phosphocholine-specific [Saccharopolyspora soli]MCI2420485.1 phospholipase C, phosphocholine-specific [Saccharopolyspora soli]
MTEVSRRRVLAGAAGVVGGAAAASLLPPSLHRAMAQPAPVGGLDSVGHVVVLMQENRSFDHYFGTLRGVRGFGDRQPLRQPDGRSAFEQPTPGGAVLPFSLRQGAERAGRPVSDIQYLGALDHSWEGSGRAWARGWNNDWIAAKTAATMTYYERPDIPLQYELADTFTICDAYHCSVFGSTNPNRNYLWTGTTGYEPGTTARAVTNAAYDYDHGGYDWTTYPERLEKAGRSWQIYQEWDNFTDNAVEYFQTFKAIGHRMLAGVDGNFRTTEEFYTALFDKPVEERQRLLKQLEAGRASLTDAERSLFDRAMYRSEPGTLVQRLREDIKADRLPEVVWLVPSAVDSEHPGSSTPVGSANLIYDVLDAIADPKIWSKTALLLNFDENDGYFDHVPPPVPPKPESGNGDDYFDGQPIGLGPRVPMTVVSPWTIGGFVNSEVFDHTSVLRLLERWTGIAEPNISAWRRAVCGDLTSVFDFRRGAKPPKPTEPGPVPAPIERWHPEPPPEQNLPVQESGSRPARALPYQPQVSGAVNGAVLALRLGNVGSSTVHFTVYPYAEELAEPSHVDVRGEQVVNVPVREEYRLAVQGPNRFWFELSGSRGGRAAGVDVQTRHTPRGLALELRNGGPQDITLRLRSLGYTTHEEQVRVAAGGAQPLEWPSDRGWYDVEVTTSQDTSFRRRITGRAENGEPGVTG